MPSLVVRNHASTSVANGFPKNPLETSLEKNFRTRPNHVYRSQEKVDINCQDADGVTILHLAAMRSEALLLYLVEEGADPVILTKTGRNALHLACRARKSNIVGYLCEVSIDIYHFQYSIFLNESSELISLTELQDDDQPARFLWQNSTPRRLHVRLSRIGSSSSPGRC